MVKKKGVMLLLLVSYTDSCRPHGGFIHRPLPSLVWAWICAHFTQFNDSNCARQLMDDPTLDDPWMTPWMIHWPLYDLVCYTLDDPLIHWMIHWPLYATPWMIPWPLHDPLDDTLDDPLTPVWPVDPYSTLTQKRDQDVLWGINMGKVDYLWIRSTDTLKVDFSIDLTQDPLKRPPKSPYILLAYSK